RSPLGIERENSAFRLSLAMCAEGISTREPCAALTDWLTRYWNGSRTYATNKALTFVRILGSADAAANSPNPSHSNMYQAPAPVREFSLFSFISTEFARRHSIRRE